MYIHVDTCKQCLSATIIELNWLVSNNWRWLCVQRPRRCRVQRWRTRTARTADCFVKLTSTMRTLSLRSQCTRGGGSVKYACSPYAHCSHENTTLTGTWCGLLHTTVAYCRLLLCIWFAHCPHNRIETHEAVTSVLAHQSTQGNERVTIHIVLYKQTLRFT